MQENLTINKTIDKKEIKKIITWYINNFGSLKATKLLDKLKLLGFKYVTKIGTSLGIKDLNIPKIKKHLINNNEKKINLLKSKIKKGTLNLIEYEDETKVKWNQINEILKTEIYDNFRKTNLLNPLYVMVISGARGNISQIKQLVGMRGLMVDPKGEIINIPIKSNLKESLNTIEYFISCYGARKGVIDTAIKTAVSGHLTRKLIYLTQDQIIKRPNCYTSNMEMILNLKIDKQYYQQSIEKILGRVISKDIKNEKLTLSAGQDICNYLAKKIINIKKIFLRSPLTCKVNFGICQLCYGWNLAHNRIAELGESVGIIAAQSIGEPGTQLTMRTFHTGGIFSGEINEIITSPIKGKVYFNIKKGKKIINLNNHSKALVTLEEKKLLIIKDKERKVFFKIPKYSLIFIKNHENVFEKQIISEILNWKKIKNKLKTKHNTNNLKEIKTTASGKISINKIAYKNKKIKHEIMITNANILTGKLIQSNLKLKNKHKLKISLTEKLIQYNKKNKIKIKKKNAINITENKIKILENLNKINRRKIMHFQTIHNIEKKRNLQIILTNKIKSTKTIKPPKNNINNINIGRNYCSNLIEKRKNTVTVRKIILYKIREKNLIQNQKRNLVKKGNIIIYTQYKAKKTKDIVQGLPKIEEILENKQLKQQKILETILKNLIKCNNSKIAIRKSIYKMQRYLVKKIQSVYSSQGIKISNKHIEIIIRKMTSKAVIKHSGESTFISGEILEINKLEKINKKLENKIRYEPIIVGISKSSIINNSFISNTCFQGVIENLTTAAIEGKIDWLNGIKENIIIGNLIPVGTGKKIYL